MLHHLLIHHLQHNDSPGKFVGKSIANLLRQGVFLELRVEHPVRTQRRWKCERATNQSKRSRILIITILNRVQILNHLFMELFFGLKALRFRPLKLSQSLARTVSGVLWIRENRTVKTLLRFFRWFGNEWSHALEGCLYGMWKPYFKIIAKKVGKAINILDRPHIMCA